ncbi:FTR1 family protein [Rhizobium ruizarguesonis]|uniref:FTR1 family iron permease n=1 Tax=Rhizobium leguminosarum TaxID=384 RepID=UPI00103D7936|nr:FTR1 family protein [Rhizobium leguminosarum]MBY5494266.1 iron permease [Rhizobium leguminosarum]TBZ40447.1 iron permease [Rhizobium leguminosarum bv. viciae]TCA06423.1 iron permease [Rhizobium leguminosarum bv. viciae]TCA19630.1 iron permease [Rhizobium leguminosarum bv. viciae]
MTADVLLQSFRIASVVWRESFEALVIVGILLAWTINEGVAVRRRAIRSIAGGAAAGVMIAVGLAFLMSGAAGFLDGDGENILQFALAAIASILMLRMVFWMQRAVRGSSKGMRSQAAGLGKARSWTALGLLSAVAVAREGAETVVFLYGMLSGSDGSATLVAGSGALGLAAACLTFLCFRSGASAFSKRAVSITSQVLLLILGSGLMMTAVDRAISLGIVPTLTSSLWDTGWILDDSAGAGAFLSALTGYRSRPELLPLLALGFYWMIASLAYAPAVGDKAHA